MARRVYLACLASLGDRSFSVIQDVPREGDLSLQYAVKTGKAAGFGGIYPEFLAHSGKNTRRWLAKFYSNTLDSGIIPTAFRRTKIIVVLKPGKPSDSPESYRSALKHLL